MTSSHVRRLNSRVSRTAARFADYAAKNDVPAAELPAAKLPWYEVRSEAVSGSEATAGSEPDTATVLLFDEIGGSFGVDATAFAEDLERITASTIKLRINSPGGSVFDALAIHNALRHHPARVVGYVDALAASAASVVAMAADELVMMPGAQLMIHDASAVHDGNPADMAKMVTFLDRQSDNIADLYQLRAGGDPAAWRALMREETWMFAQEAVEFGLADRVEHPRSEVPDPASEEPLTRSFDLSQFRYAGRDNAPRPTWPPRAVSSTKAMERSHTGSATMTADVAQRAHDRVSAAAARMAALGGGNGGDSRHRSSVLPCEVGAARLVPAQAQLKAKLETRGEQELFHLEGIASVTDKAYRMWDVFGEYDEIVTRSAFDATLAASPDVAFLLNHKGMTMARTTAGTLELSMSDQGLKSSAWLNPKRQDVKDLVVAIEDGNITEMSFAFMLEEGEWSDDFTEFRITSLDINRGDVSAVNYGANPYTSIAARSTEILGELDRLPTGAARAALDRLNARADVRGPLSRHVPEQVRKAAETSGAASVDYYEKLLNLF